jgi:hypothetical protein
MEMHCEGEEGDERRGCARAGNRVFQKKAYDYTRLSFPGAEKIRNGVRGGGKKSEDGG